MNQRDKNGKRIPASQIQVFSGWSLPEVSGEHVVGLHCKEYPDDAITVLEDELTPDKLTLADLETIREDAQREGFEQGKAEGLAQGLEEGRREGLAKGQEEGHAQGLATGQEQGFATGLEQGKEEIQAARAALEQMLQELDAPVGEIQQQLESLVVDLALKVASTVIQHELSIRPELIRQTVQEALAQLPPPVARATLRLNPADLSYVEPLAAKCGFELELVGDDAVGRGSCQLATTNTLVESDVQAAYQQLVEQLAEQLGDGSQEGG